MMTEKFSWRLFPSKSSRFLWEDLSESSCQHYHGIQTKRSIKSQKKYHRRHASASKIGFSFGTTRCDASIELCLWLISLTCYFHRSQVTSNLNEFTKQFLIFIIFKPLWNFSSTLVHHKNAWKTFTKSSLLIFMYVKQHLRQ
jgi:hypothetical protein